MRSEKPPSRDVVALRIAFFDQHLQTTRARGPTCPTVSRCSSPAPTSGEASTAFRRPRCTTRELFLQSDGHANSSRGDGALVEAAPTATPSQPDRFVDDPDWPFVGGMTQAKGPAFAMDLRERESNHDTLVYRTGPLTQAMTLLGEPEVELFTTADVPDADLCVWLAEHRPDGSTTFLAMGQQRLRYHAGFDAERPITPGDVVRVRFALTYVGHRVAAGHELRLLVSGSNFPLLDPNPHTGEPDRLGLGHAARGANRVSRRGAGRHACSCPCCPIEARSAAHHKVKFAGSWRPRRDPSRSAVDELQVRSARATQPLLSGSSRSWRMGRALIPEGRLRQPRQPIRQAGLGRITR